MGERRTVGCATTRALTHPTPWGGSDRSGENTLDIVRSLLKQIGLSPPDHISDIFESPPHCGVFQCLSRGVPLDSKYVPPFSAPDVCVALSDDWRELLHTMSLSERCLLGARRGKRLRADVTSDFYCTILPSPTINPVTVCFLQKVLHLILFCLITSDTKALFCGLLRLFIFK